MSPRYTAFEGHKLLASGAIRSVISKTRTRMADPDAPSILLFDDATGRQTDLDFRGSVAEILARLEQPVAVPQQGPARGKGRPKLGVVSKEVTLLPRHWEWLRAQPGGASATLRKLVDTARKANSSEDAVRQAQNRCYAFMTAIGGDLAGFEEATRALFGADQLQFEAHLAAWPKDLNKYIQRLVSGAFEKPTGCLDGGKSR